MKMETEKRKVWVISVLLKDIDPDDGEEIHWNGEMPEYYADTYNEAEVIAKKLLNGGHEYYGNLVESCEISLEPVEIVWI